MFTVGIFSTHLPYIAFVFFYAYFFFIGIPKASNGDFSCGEEIFNTETHFVQKYNFLGEDDHNVDQVPPFYFYHSTNSDLASEEKFLFLKTQRKKAKQNLPSYSVFCRPPPAA